MDERCHQLRGERLVPDRFGIERQEVIRPVDEHPRAEQHTTGNDEVLHRPAPAGWTTAAWRAAPKMRGLASSVNIER